MTQQTISPLDETKIKDHILSLIAAGWTNKSIAKNVESTFMVETTDDSIRRFRKRHGVQIPGVEKASIRIKGDEAEATTKVKQRTRDMYDGPVLDDPDTMLRDRGLDPDDWYIDNVTVNEWDGPQKDGNVVTYYQAKFTAKRKRPLSILQPVRSDGWVPPRNARKVFAFDDPQLVVICGDQQAPFHDPQLHELFCEWLNYNEPERGIALGDFIDLPDISRHPNDPENDASAQECLQAGYDLWRGYVFSSPDTEWEYMPGNHDERIRQYLTKNAPRAFDLSRVDTPEEPGNSVYSLAHLMRLDELGVHFVEPYGTYEDTQVELSKHLAVRHGWIVRQGSGASALKTLEQTGYCVPLDTTILTQEGWKTHDQVQVGDRTIGYNHDTGCSEWTEITAIHHFENEPLVEIGHTRWRARVTPRHRWIVARRKRLNGAREYQTTMKSTSDICGDDRIVLSAPLEAAETVSAQDAAIVAWLWTDGHWKQPSERTAYHDRFNKNPHEQAEIYQYKQQGVNSLRTLLADIPHSEYDRTDCGRGMVFRLQTSWVRALRERTGLDRLTPEQFVLSLGTEALEAFIQACWLAEGWDNHGSRIFAQNEGPVLEAMRLAVYLIGRFPSLSYNDATNWNVNFSRPVVVGSSLDSRRLDSAPVWCVETALGSWTMRQDRQISLTGNSIIIGHTHRQSIVHHTVHDIDRNATTLLAAEAGCMCRITSHRDSSDRRFPAYAVMPDWQNGFCTATVYPDGRFKVDLATFVNGILMWRDQRYE